MRFRHGCPPDGRFYLYVSDESGTREVFARTFPDGEKKWQISTAGGSQPHWSPTGTEIFYAENRSLIAVDLVDPVTFTLGRPTRVPVGDLSLSSFDHRQIRHLRRRTPEVEVCSWSARLVVPTPPADSCSSRTGKNSTRVGSEYRDGRRITIP